MKTVERKLSQVQKERIQNLIRQTNEFQKELTALLSFMAPDNGRWSLDTSKVNEGLLIFVEREGEQDGKESSKTSQERSQGSVKPGTKLGTKPVTSLKSARK